MTQFIQNPNGKLAGSIGDGRDRLPAATPPVPPTSGAPAAAAPSLAQVAADLADSPVVARPGCPYCGHTRHTAYAHDSRTPEGLVTCNSCGSGYHESHNVFASFTP
ncbi:MAG: hypothetical protein QG597_4012 [Actinomycetota bacterium]|jgi:hypothetical protein|nr:hypothetical protein [Actinomycetota bacterium]